MSMLKRLRCEARDALELLLLPGLAAILPWSLCFAIFKRISRWSFLYREACEAALAQARALGHARRPVEWINMRRLVTLVDHADFFLAVTRSDKWMQRHMVVHGEWPQAGAAGILCTFHWGAGMWALRHAAAHGLRAHALIAPHGPESFPGHTVRFWYYGWRNAAVARALGCWPIEITRSLRPALEALHLNEQVLAAVDVPSDLAAASEAIEFLGRRAYVPRGLLRVAAESRVPVTVFVTGIRLTDGKRTLHLHRLGSRSDAAALLAEVFALLNEAIVAQPAAWHFWQAAPRFFEAEPPRQSP
jgi:hypothetical protein